MVSRYAPHGAFIGFFLLLPHLAAQPPAPARTRTFRSAVDDSNQPYALYLPRSFRAGVRYPLVISLHSEQSNHRLNLRQVFGIPSRLGEADRDDMRFFAAMDSGYVVACPLARGTMGYQGVAETDVYDVLADVQRRLPIDPDRVYLTGISMGGSGALRLALTRPSVWAAVAAVCPSGTPGFEALAPNALNVPIRLFHGDQDPIVPVEVSRRWHRRLLDEGAPVEYIEYPGVRHDAWDFAYKGGALFEWFDKSRRNPFPERVRFVTQSYRYATAYWVQIDGLTPGVAASIDAKRVGAAEIQVQTANLDGFTLSLNSPADNIAIITKNPSRGKRKGAANSATLAVTIDGAALRVKPAVTLSFEKVAGRWRAGRFQPPGKRPGAEGPIAEALAGRQIYVYGTVGAANAEELAARRKVAETAANWSTSRARLGLTFAVKADSAVTASDLDAADLILFGSRETNSLIARFAPRFPLELNPGAADYGLLFIVPIGKHYAMVSSGRPWWSGTGDWERPGDPFAPPHYRVLSTLGDYVLFKGSLAHIIAEGRFNRDWKVPPDASAKMMGTGTVTIH